MPSGPPFPMFATRKSAKARAEGITPGPINPKPPTPTRPLVSVRTRWIWAASPGSRRPPPSGLAARSGRARRPRFAGIHALRESRHAADTADELDAFVPARIAAARGLFRLGPIQRPTARSKPRDDGEKCADRNPDTEKFLLTKTFHIIASAARRLIMERYFHRRSR
jgi:hypothetical protein